MLLFTFIIRDTFGHSMPIAWMIASSGTGNTIDYFLKHVRLRSPSIHPSRFMSDHDRAQMSKITARYPESQLLLCWWHVPHDWQKHLAIMAHPELWAKLKLWFRITELDEFMQCYEEIKELAPDYFIEYLEKNWLGEYWEKLWSAVYRKDRTVLKRVIQICSLKRKFFYAVVPHSSLISCNI
jgi:hypothetical protein